MSISPISHGSFTIEREYKTSPEQVFKAWSDPRIKATWFVGGGAWKEIERSLDFSIGGSEILKGRFPHRETLYKARFHEIVVQKRIVYVYDMYVGDIHHSLSLASVEFIDTGIGTRMIFNEQIAFLDGTDGKEGAQSREHGVGSHFDNLPALLEA